MSDTDALNPHEKQAALERAEYVEMKRLRGEHVLAADCWCRPIVDPVPCFQQPEKDEPQSPR